MISFFFILLGEADCSKLMVGWNRGNNVIVDGPSLGVEGRKGRILES